MLLQSRSLDDIIPKTELTAMTCAGVQRYLNATLRAGFSEDRFHLDERHVFEFAFAQNAVRPANKLQG